MSDGPPIASGKANTTTERQDGIQAMSEMSSTSTDPGDTRNDAMRESTRRAPRVDMVAANNHSRIHFAAA